LQRGVQEVSRYHFAADDGHGRKHRQRGKQVGQGLDTG